MFSFQLNIGSLATPVKGGGWVTVVPDYSNTTLAKELENKMIFTRTKINGNLLFCGDEYTALNQLRSEYETEVEISINHTDNNNVLTNVLIGVLNLMGDYDSDKAICELKTEVNDGYENLLKDYDKEYSILDNHSIKKVEVSQDGGGWALYTRFMRLDEIIKYVVGQIDSAIKFDNISFAHFYSNEDSRHYTIANIENVLSGSTLADVSKASLKKIFEWLQGFRKTYWNLELIGLDYYFRIKHRSELGYTTGTNPDTTNYKNINWCADKNKYRWIIKDLYYRLKRNINAKNEDFIGTDIKINALQNIEKVKEINNSTFDTDIWHIQANPEDYPTASENEYCLLTNNLQNAGGSYQGLINGSITNPGNEQFDYFHQVTNNIILDHSYTGKACCYYNQLISLIAGDVVSFYLKSEGNVYDITDNLYVVLNNGDGTIGTARSNIVKLCTGHDVVNLKCNTTGNWYLMIYKETGVFPGQTQLSNMVIGAEYKCRIRTGIISGNSISNVELSLANLDNDYNRYELPYHIINNNGSNHTITDTVRLIKDKEIEIELPIYKPDEIEETELIPTGLGNVEFRKLSIKMYESTAKLKGVFR